MEGVKNKFADMLYHTWVVNKLTQASPTNNLLVLENIQRFYQPL